VHIPAQGKERVKGEFEVPRPAEIKMNPDKLLANNSQKSIP